MRNWWTRCSGQGTMKCRWVLWTGLSLLAMVMATGISVSAQDKLNCGDFKNQPEAQASLNESYPDDPNRLDADKDWIACEDFFKLTDKEAARVVPADKVNSAGQATPEPTPAPTPDDAAPAPTAPPTASAGTSTRVDPPADLMAQVASCEVVAVSSRSIAAAGCPGVGSMVLRPPAGTPRMRSQVIIRPGAALAAANERTATAAQTAVLGHPAGKRDRGQHERPKKKRHKGAEHTSKGNK